MKHKMNALSFKLCCSVEDDCGSGYQYEPIPQVGALYALWDENAVVYIGITKDLQRRIVEHTKEKDFSHFSYFECEDLQRREELEIIFFDVLNPVLNKEHPAQSHLRTNPRDWPKYLWEEDDGLDVSDESFSIKIPSHDQPDEECDYFVK